MKKILLLLTTCIATYILHAQTYNTCTAALGSTTITAGTYNVGTINGSAPTSYCVGSSDGVTAGEWIKYVPANNYTVTISSDLEVNGDKDTRFHVFAGSCNSLICVSGDDDSGIFGGTNGISNLSKATFPVVSGQTYYIVWDNKWTNSSNFDFSLTEDPYVAPPAPSDISFVQQSITSSGLNRAVVDMNGDFLDDLVSISNTNININYQLPSGGFNTVNITTTPADFLPSWSLAAGDFDANGYNDLLYGDTNGVTFMRANANGTAYTEISGPQNVFSQRSNFVDINNDGHLDAFVCHDLNPSISYMNDGSNNLIYTNTNGLGGYASGGNYGSVWIDYDNDGDIDMFMSKCGGNEARRTNQLYRNNGNGTYTEVGSSAGLADILQTWSAAWGDYDNDGDMDVYVGSSVNDAINPNKIMRNNGDGTFTDVSVDSGIFYAQKGYENIPGDFNNDGYLDIFTNGDILFGNGDLTFTVAKTLAIPDLGAIGDLNNDGFLDFFYNSIYTNSGNSNNWIKIATIGDTAGGYSNKNGIGARVEINTDIGTQIRDVRSGEGFRFMHSLNTHFGIGAETTINFVKIIWPSGIVDIIPNPNINELLIVNEGSTLSLENSFVSNLILYPNPTNSSLNLNLPMDLEGGAVYTVFDMNGRRILNSKLDSNKIDVSNLNPGNYILRTMSGTTIRSQKFIKQ